MVVFISSISMLVKFEILHSQSQFLKVVEQSDKVTMQANIVNILNGQTAGYWYIINKRISCVDLNTLSQQRENLSSLLQVAILSTCYIWQADSWEVPKITPEENHYLHISHHSASVDSSFLAFTCWQPD